MPSAKETLAAEYPVVISVQLHWGEMDAFAHLNNAVYFRYFESARIAYFQRMGIVGEGAGPVGPILASTSCRFKAPLKFPDSVRVGARVGDVGEDRFLMEYRIVSETLDRVAASGDGLIVSYDYDAARKVELPAGWRASIAGIEAEAT